MGSAQTYYQRTYGTADNELGGVVIETSDGQLLIGGSTEGCIATPSSTDAYLVKCDRHGVIQWSRHYYYTSTSDVRALAPTADGGCVMISEGLCKLAADGTPLWGYLGRFNDLAVVQDSIILGIGALGPDRRCIELVRFTQQGDTVLHRRYTGIQDPLVARMIPTADGAAVVVGRGKVGTSVSHAFILKLNVDGDIIWARTLEAAGPWGTLFTDVCTMPDGGFTVVGVHEPAWQPTPIVVRFDADGDTLWTRQYASGYCAAYKVAPTANGVLVGTDGYDDESLNSLLHINDAGDMVRRIRPPGEDHTLPGPYRLSDGDIAITTLDQDVWLSTTDIILTVLDPDLNGLWCTEDQPVWDPITNPWTLGNIAFSDTLFSGLTDFAPQDFPCAASSTDTLCTSGDMGMAEHTEPTLSLYPNPANDVLHVRCVGARPIAVKVFDLLGQPMAMTRRRASEDEVEVNVSGLAAGHYLVRVQSSKGVVIRLVEVR